MSRGAIILRPFTIKRVRLNNPSRITLIFPLCLSILRALQVRPNYSAVLYPGGPMDRILDLR